jgi:hemerythrin-like metal-binding protein
MGFFPWENIDSVGVAKIDAQNMKLFEIANRFHAAFERRESRQVLVAIFTELVEYTGTYIAGEDRLLQEHGYPDHKRHKANHALLVGLVLTYKRQLENGEPDIEQHAMGFIKTWLNDHVLGMDRSNAEHEKPRSVV